MATRGHDRAGVTDETAGPSPSPGRRTRTPGPIASTGRSSSAGTARRTAGFGAVERTTFVTEVAGGTRRAAELLDVAPSQPSRWASGESAPSPKQARVLVDIDHVLAHAMLVWADPGVARDWLTTPNAHLEGLRPVDWIRTYGTAEVVDALRAEAAGAFA